MLRAYERYKDGHLPSTGGLIEQTQCFNEALPWISRLWAFHEALSNDAALRNEIEKEKAR